MKYMKNRVLRMAFALLWASPAILAAGTIVVKPANESVVVGGQRYFTPTVSGVASSGVAWSVNGMPGGNSMFGTIDANGMYTAPPVVPSSNPVTVTATSTADMTVSGSTGVTIKTVGPTLAAVVPSSFTAGAFSVKITGSVFQPGAVAYLGTTAQSTTFVSSTQLGVTGTAVAGTQQFRVVNPGSMFSAPINVIVTSGGGGGGTLTVQPATATVAVGSTQQFTAQNAGAGLAWSVNGLAGGNAASGLINTSGLYTAPATKPNPATVTVTAAAGGSTASATVTIISNQPATITLVNPAPIPVGVFTLTINGTGFRASSIASLGAVPMSTQFVSATSLTAVGYASQAGNSNITIANGGAVSQPFSVQVGVANPLVSSSAARRFLEHGAFGPTPSDATHVQQVGFQGWINEQCALPKTSNYQLSGSQSNMPPRFVTNAVMQPDQLRQRVAFAYSQIFVSSLNTNIWTSIMGPYQDMLLSDAFVNFRQIIQDVTLNPAMGQFLNMANNAKGNAQGTILPNENYAREVMQLFAIGTSMLNPDGTPKLDAQGNFIPTYTQQTVAEFARVFTGWTYQPQSGPVNWGAYINPAGPMVPYAPMHDANAKTILNGVVLPAGQTALQDLAGALDNLFNHPNAGPFIGKQLIQHLVKSNPTPAYVARVTAAFNDNGQGVRGDMKAVISAILLDPEARANDAGGMDQPTDGHLQEPVLFLAGFLRALNAQVNDQNYFSWDLYNMSQDLFNPPSVFNYYSPRYGVPGAGITGGEFQIYTPATSLYRDNLVSGLFGNYQGSIQTNGPGTAIDLTPYVTLAATPSQLVDALDIALTHGDMPSQMKQILVSAVQAEGGGNLRRVQTALYLILASSYYNVWH